jgi:hypothetical protein
VPNKTDREIVQHFDHAFASLIVSLKDLATSVPSDLSYHHVVRSAAAIEQMCGGLTSNLWDDPYEWTLPETLSNADRVVEYLSEVDRARQRAFNTIGDDRALTKYISGPSGEPQLLVGLLLATLVKAAEFAGRARTVKAESSVNPDTPRFII